MPHPHTLSSFITLARKKHGRKYEYVDYINSYTKITIVCPVHGPFLQRPRDHLYGNGCPKCGWEKEKRGRKPPSKRIRGKVVSVLKVPKRTRTKHYKNTPRWLLMSQRLHSMRVGEFLGFKALYATIPSLRTDMARLALRTAFERAVPGTFEWLNNRGIVRLVGKAEGIQQPTTLNRYTLLTYLSTLPFNTPLPISTIALHFNVKIDELVPLLLTTIFHQTRPYTYDMLYDSTYAPTSVLRIDPASPPPPEPNTIFSDLAWKGGAQNRFQPSPCLPTSFAPGSPNKIAVLAARARRGESLWHSDDKATEFSAAPLLKRLTKH